MANNARIERTRRRMIQLTSTAALIGLAGCSGGDGGDEDGEDGGGDGEEGEELPEGVSEEEFTSGPVPDAYMSAMSLGGEDRVDDLTSKDEANFLEYDAATENEMHEDGQSCGNCADYIPDKNGDGFGACAEVEGYIDMADWCEIYEVLPEPEVPEGMSEGELATAEVPAEYRTATSQGDETRDPSNLQTQEDVNLMESVEAIAEGMAEPGNSCGTCADFIPDQNGDTWGACAEVEGWIAVEDYCSVYEHVGEEH